MHHPFHPNPQVYWNNKKVGTTAYVDDTLDPVWDLEIFSIKVDAEGPNSVELSTLRIECLDRDQFGSDDVLGQIELSGSQVMQLIGSGEQDRSMDTTQGDAIGEADMGRVFEFIQTFQKHQKEEGSLGKMTVGVPQYSKVASINSEESVAIAHEAADVAPVPLKREKGEREILRRDVAMETAGNSGGKESTSDVNTGREKGNALNIQGSRGGGEHEDAGGSNNNRQRQQQQGITNDECHDAGARPNVEGGVVEGNPQQAEHMGEAESQGRGQNGVLSANGNNVRMDQERLGLVAIAEDAGDEKHEVTTVSGYEHNTSPDCTRGNLGVVGAGMYTAKAGSVIVYENPPNSYSENDHLPKLTSDAEVLLTRTPVTGEPAPDERLRSDLKKRGGASEKAPDEEIKVAPRDKRGPKSALGDRDPIGASYRDGKVFCAATVVVYKHEIVFKWSKSTCPSHGNLTLEGNIYLVCVNSYSDQLLHVCLRW